MSRYNTSLSPESAIGMFDSGVGGLTVMRQLAQTLPNENIVYFGDTARVPYGEKSRETIIRYSIENAIFLMQQNIKMLVIACNTASACAIDHLRQIFNIPIIGVIEPGAQSALKVSKTGRIAVIGTKGTVRSGAYQEEIQKKRADASVLSLACPLFVPLVEEQWLHHPAAKMIVQEYLEPIQKNQIDTLLLGCTHYPLLHHLIAEHIGPNISIVDSATACAQEVQRVLEAHGLLRESELLPTHRYFVSDDPEKFRAIGSQFFGGPLPSIDLASSKF